MLGRRKSYLLSSAVKKEQEEAAKVQLPTRFRRIVLVAEAREDLSRWRTAATAKTEAASIPARSASPRSRAHVVLPSPGRAHRHSDSEVDVGRPVVTSAPRHPAWPLAEAPFVLPGLPPPRLWPRAPQRDADDDGDGDAASALSLNSTMTLIQSDADAIRTAAEQACRRAGERYRAEQLARQEESADKRYIELTRGGAFLLASASPTRRVSRVESGRAPRSSLEHILMPALALATLTSAPDARPKQSYADYVDCAERLDPRRQYVAVVAVGKVPRQVVRAARFAAKALVGLEVVVLTTSAAPTQSSAWRRTPAADDVETAAREATRRAERQRRSASRPPAPGVEPRQIRQLLATIALADVDLLPAAAQPASAADAGPLIIVAREPGDGVALGQRFDVGVVVREVQRAIGRLLGIERCDTYACALADDDARAAAHVCPICLRKLLWTSNMSLDAHVAAQREAKGCAPEDGALEGAGAGATPRPSRPGDGSPASQPASTGPRRRSYAVELDPIRPPSRPAGAVAISRRRSL